MRTFTMLSIAALAAIAASRPRGAAAASGYVDQNTDICNAPVNLGTSGTINIVNHAFLNGTDTTQPHQLWVAYGRGSSWGWRRMTSGTVTVGQIACAAADAQGLVVYRDSNGNLRSMDRLSGWQDFAVPSGGGTNGTGRWATTVLDQNRKKIVLFWIKDSTSGLMMSVWDDTASGSNKWGSAVSLGPSPGGTITSREYRLAGYTYDLGYPPNTTPAISVFVVGVQDAHLWENRGGMTSGTRFWIDRGTPPGKMLAPSNVIQQPAAAAYRSTFGHPPPITEGDYNKRVTLPASTWGNPNEDSTYALIQTGAGDFTWQLIDQSGVPFYQFFNLKAGLVSAGCAPGQPCFPAVMTVGTRDDPNPLTYGTRSVAANISANQSSGTWVGVGPTFGVNGQAAPVRPDGSASDMLLDGAVLMNFGGSVWLTDLKTNAQFVVGAPPP